MTTSTSRLAYDDIFELLEETMETKKGKRIPFNKRDNIPDNRGEAIQFRVRLHTARTIDRSDNANLYPKEHPLHGRSKYDILCASVKTENGKVYLYITKRSLENYEIEDLDGATA